jgi:acyl-CoA reductase-like NAD-dependent aldehyde dehydrogenase
MMTLEMGKPLAEAYGEVAYGAEFLRWSAEEAPRVSGRYATAPDGLNRLMVTKRPVGPCLLITPWNFRLAMATRKIAPAIAAGCTMVLKPADVTPLTALLLTQILEQAGLSPGVLKVITTTDPGGVTGPLSAWPARAASSRPPCSPRSRLGHPPGGDLRPGGLDRPLRHRRGGRPAGERYPLRARLLRLHPRPGPWAADGGTARNRHARPQHRRGVQPRRPLRRVKQSGLGREGGAEGIGEYLETCYIGICDPFRELA